ncbi:MAG: alpha/beta hydrolase [Chitinophagaceae bacterium]|nr:alpha/beta hydrolase [Chitinophagaceae bacterium]
MRKYPFLLVALLCTGALNAQKFGPYEGPLQSFRKWYAGNNPDSIYGMFNTQMKGAVGADNWRHVFVQIKEAVGDLEAFDLDAGNMGGYNRFAAAGSKHSLMLLLVIDSNLHIAGLFNRPGKSTKTVYHTNYKIAVPGGELYGELLTPAPDAGQKPPVALIIAGSGPTDRDGNNPLGVKAAPYRMLSESLQKNGIATYRYDKRFIGESANIKGRMDTLRIEDYIDDAVKCIQRLRADGRFSRVIVIGHSEGALIGVVAAREGHADGYISLAGAGASAEVVLRRQFAQMGLSRAGVDSALGNLEKGQEIYYKSWASYDPAKEIVKLKIPVLIIQGLTDLQVQREDAERLKSAAPKSSLVFIDSMNHVLKDAPTDRARNVATYENEQLPLNKKLVDTVVAFVKRN